MLEQNLPLSWPINNLRNEDDSDAPKQSIRALSRKLLCDPNIDNDKVHIVSSHHAANQSRNGQKQKAGNLQTADLIKWPKTKGNKEYNR